MSLRENLNKLIEETLTMETVTDPRLQSQPMYDSDNAVDYTEEVQEMSQQVPKKAKISLLKMKLSTDTRLDILQLESNIHVLELSLETFYRTFRILELAKMTFIMKFYLGCLCTTF